MFPIPTPSKRPWNFPVPATALEHLVHPAPGHHLALPFQLPVPGSAGSVITFNGGLAVRIHTPLPTDLEIAPHPWEAVTIIANLPWPSKDESADESRWRPLDDAAGHIWRFGPREVWLPLPDHRAELNTRHTVKVGESCTVPTCLLQLCARLPRCRVCIDNRAGQPLRFIFNGGEALILPLPNLPYSSFSILPPKRDLFTEEAVYTGKP